ncbi:MAG: hypothetical protein HYT31_03810 [Parcubacteria group bacterium]|nr:hypothetical protein [Parcubacteria group bacterium]
MEDISKKQMTLDSLDISYLSDKRYFELKHRDALIAQWVKAIAEKTGVPVDFGQLEKIN